MSRGGNTSKIHAIVDALGNPLAFLLTGRNVHDSTPAIDLLAKVSIKGLNILADKAYGSATIREWIVQQEASYTIPPKDNTKEPWEVDWYLYKERHLVECFFNKLKHFRRIATRYDKLASSFRHYLVIFKVNSLYPHLATCT